MSYHPSDTCFIKFIFTRPCFDLFEVEQHELKLNFMKKFRSANYVQINVYVINKAENGTLTAENDFLKIYVLSYIYVHLRVTLVYVS